MAEHDGEVAGHILFTPVEIGAAARRACAATAWRRWRCVPSRSAAVSARRWCEAGLARVQAAGAPFVFVIGHPAYYPRFGFVPASRHGVRCQWPDIPDEAVMLLVLDAGRAMPLAGEARYRPEFDAAV